VKRYQSGVPYLGTRQLNDQDAGNAGAKGWDYLRDGR
jgi:hypothetical protein